MKVTFEIDGKKMSAEEAKEYLGPELKRELAQRFFNNLLKSIKEAKVTLQ